MSNVERTVQVFEREKMTVKQIEGSRLWLSSSERKSLEEYNEANDNKFFSLIAGGVKFGQYVGTLKVGNLTIEILPKIDQESSDRNRDAEVVYWGHFLMNMLKATGELKYYETNDLNLRWRKVSLLDLYALRFLAEVEKVIRRGLFKTYQKKRTSTKALRGRILFSRQVRKPPGLEISFDTIASMYTFDHALNQLLQDALKRLTRYKGNQLVVSKALKLRRKLPEQISGKTVDWSMVKKIHWDRKTTPYRRAITMAERLFRGQAPDLYTGGKLPVTALLFDMEKLWEKFIAKQLLKHQNPNFEVLVQSKKTWWSKRLLKPDLVIKVSQGVTTKSYIIDTKWKCPKSGSPSRDDLFQMFIYNVFWQAEEAILLYPGKNREHDELAESYSIQVNSLTPSCKVCFLDMDGFDDPNLDIGKRVMEKMALPVGVLQR